MRINYIRIENFRNFRLCKVELGQNIILVGENKAGKSNFIHALRLILDPSLSDQERYLTEDDFWDGIEPFKGNEIRITIQLTDFADDEEEPDFLPLAWLSDCLITHQPKRIAQLTYLYSNEKKQDHPEESGIDDYEFMIFPGNAPGRKFDIRGMRRDMPLQLITAIRDIASDIHAWRRSPLRRLIKLSDLKPEQLDPFIDEIMKVNQGIFDLEPLSELQQDIQSRLAEMIGIICDNQPSLNLIPSRPEDLINVISLYMDGDKNRELERISLGLQNALYLSLLSLLLDKQEVVREKKKERFLVILALEEPEAHLHPHLQRLVFHDFLERAANRKQPVVISSHSPHLVSTSNIEDLVLFMDYCDHGCESTSAYSFLRDLGDRERKDLDRFLDITKSEMLFAKGVIFVEGDVEMILVVEFARIMGISFDRHGISICNTFGTQFLHVVTLAQEFGIPFLVLTDGDTDRPVTGLSRCIELVRGIKPSRYDRLMRLYEAGSINLVKGWLRRFGFFLNEWTLESSLVDSGLTDELKKTFTDLGEELGQNVTAGSHHIDSYLADPTEENKTRILTSIADARWGKGRFAHRLLQHIQDKAGTLDTQEEKNEIVPEYIREGIRYLVNEVESLRS